MGPFLSIIKNNKYTMLSENCATFVNYIQPVVIQLVPTGAKTFLTGALKRPGKLQVCTNIHTLYVQRRM